MKRTFTLKTILSALALGATLNLSAATNYVAEFTDSTQGIQLHSTVLNVPVRTVEFWFKPADDFLVGSHNEFQAIIGRDNAQQVEEWGLYLNHLDGHLKFYRRIGTTQYEIESDSTEWSSAKYYHVVGTIDTTYGMKLFIDGVKQQDTNSTTSPIYDFADDTYIGKWGDLNIRHFKGRIDDFKMWTKGMSDNEVMALSCGAPSDTSALRFWLDMESLDPNVSIAKDVSSFSFDSNVHGVLNKVEEIICTPLSEDQDPSFNLETVVWPNPSNDIFNLSTTPGAQVSIFDALGNELSNFSASSSNTQFVLKEPGIYFVRVLADNKWQSIRVVKL